MKSTTRGLLLLVGLWSSIALARGGSTANAISPADPKVVAIVEALPLLQGCSPVARYDIADDNSRAYVEYHCRRVRNRSEYAALKALFISTFTKHGWRVVDDKVGPGRTAELQMANGPKGIDLCWHPEQKAALGGNETADYHVIVTVRIQR